MFSEKRALAVAHPAFAPIADRMEADLRFVEKRLRNPIDHGSEFALTRRDACDAAAAARLLREWTEWFRTGRQCGLGVPPIAPATRATAADDR